MDNAAADRPEVSVVIPVSDDARTLRQMLENVKGMTHSAEVIVVCPAGTRITYPQGCSSWVRVIPSASFQTYDQGRALGAYHARGEAVVFLDERVVVAPALLKRLVRTIRDGVDIAVTADTRPAQPKRAAPHHAYRLLNHLLGRAELGSCTMSRVPYACSRRSLDLIGCDSLSVPPVAFAQAVKENLKIAKVSPVLAVQSQRVRGGTMKKGVRQILHEHALAIQLLLQWTGRRGGLPDGDRYRSLLMVSGTLHLRSVFHQHAREGTGGMRSGKRKKKPATNRKKT